MCFETLTEDEALSIDGGFNVACAGGAVIAGIVFATCIAAAPVTMGQSIGVAIGALGSLTITGLGTAFAFGS